METTRSRPSMLSTRRTPGAVTTSLTCVPLTAAGWHARAIASTAAWSHDAVPVMSAISTAAPRLITASRRSLSWLTLDTSMWAGNATIAWRPAHSTGKGSSRMRRSPSAGQEDAEEQRGQRADPGERAEDRAAARRPGPDVQRGSDAGDGHDHELNDERGPVAGALTRRCGPMTEPGCGLSAHPGSVG